MRTICFNGLWARVELESDVLRCKSTSEQRPFSQLIGIRYRIDPGDRWIATSTRCRRRNWRARTRRRGRSTNCCGRWRKTTTHEPKVLPSRMIWSAHGINESATTRPIRRACARVGTSFLCITATDPALTQVALARGPGAAGGFRSKVPATAATDAKTHTMPGHELHLNLNCLVASWQHPTGQGVGEAAGRAHGP